MRDGEEKAGDRQGETQKDIPSSEKTCVRETRGKGGRAWLQRDAQQGGDTWAPLGCRVSDVGDAHSFCSFLQVYIHPKRLWDVYTPRL